MSDIIARIIPYQDGMQPHFERLNRAWIELYFVIEETDQRELSDPHSIFIAPGGQIFFVVEESGEVMGTCAIKPHSPDHQDEFHLSKMAVSEAARGRGYGNLLLQAAIAYAREAGARSIILVSNRRLTPALTLYAKHGFREVPLNPDEDYTRADIQMQLDLTQAVSG